MSTTKICLKDTILCLDTLNQKIDKKTPIILNTKQDINTQEWEIIPIVRKNGTKICKEIAKLNKAAAGIQDKTLVKRDWPTISKRFLKHDLEVVNEYTDIVKNLNDNLDLSANYRKYNKLSYTSDVNDE